MSYINRRTWKEFRESGLLWWINMILHTFGWAIIISIDDDKEVKEAYPARVKFRGFPMQSNRDGYIEVSKYMRDNCEELVKEAKEK